MLATVAALDYLHDAWFYWTHRALHWKPLYVRIHLPHHRWGRGGAGRPQGGAAPAAPAGGRGAAPCRVRHEGDLHVVPVSVPRCLLPAAWHASVPSRPLCLPPRTTCRSTAPTAFCGYSFHPVEALVVFANEVLVCYLLPIHVGLHRAYHLFTTIIHEGAPPARWAAREGAPALTRPRGARLSCLEPLLQARSCTASEAHPWAHLPTLRRLSAGGHAGYEIAPFVPSLEGLVVLLLGGARAARPCGALNTVRHHDMHHRYPRSHFSLYMTHWDWLCGTEHPDYRRDVAAHFAAEGRADAATAAAR